MKPRRLLVLLSGVLFMAVNIWAQQNPTASPSPSPQSAEQKALRERRLAERRLEMQKREAANKARRAAEAAKRAEELKARRSKEASERQARQLKRAAERKLRTEKQSAERQAMAAKRAIAQKEAAKRAVENEKRRGPSDGTFRFLSSRMNADFAKVVKGAPYSAVAVTEFVQKFADGNQILRRNEAAYYRDSEGRTRVEQKLNTIGKWSAAGDAPRIIMIGDPVSGEYYDLDPRTRTAVKNVRLSKRAERQKVQEQEKAARAGQLKPPAKPRQPKPPQPLPKPPAPPEVPQVSSDGRRRTENLGSQRIEGVEAQGKRTTTTIPAGEIGNTLPIEITEESWYSPELQTVVMTKRRDPRSGETTYRLTNISRRDPARSLFQVPADYTIVDRSAPKPAPQKTKAETGKVSRSQIFE